MNETQKLFGNRKRINYGQRKNGTSLIRKQFQNEFKEDLEKLYGDTVSMSERIEEILEKKSITKGDREEINKMMSKIRRELTSNTPYMINMFNEQMDKTVNEAKCEFDATVEHKIRSLGIEGLEKLIEGRPEQNLLEDKSEETEDERVLEKRDQSSE
jgi:hypothetical protein